MWIGDEKPRALERKGGEFSRKLPFHKRTPMAEYSNDHPLNTADFHDLRGYFLERRPEPVGAAAGQP